MTAYVIGRIEVTEPEVYQEYIARTPQSIADHGGRFAVRGGELETMEGDPETRRIVVLEFPSFAAARQWYDSADYREIRKLRLASANSELLIVKGADES